MLLAKRTPGRAAGYDWSFSWDEANVPLEVPDKVGLQLLSHNSGFDGFYRVTSGDKAANDGTDVVQYLVRNIQSEDLKSALVVSDSNTFFEHI